MGKFKKIDDFCKENDREGLIEFLADHGVQNPHKQADIYIESYAKNHNEYLYEHDQINEKENNKWDVEEQ